MPAVDIDREAAHEAAQRELAKPIYPSESLTDRLSDWLDELLYRVMLKGSSFPGGWFTLTVLAILIVAAIVVAVRIARKTMRTRRIDDLGMFGTHILSAAEHRAVANGYASQGDWAAAIRHRLRAVARQLEESGLVDPIPGRTANELARDAGAVFPNLVSDFSSAASLFNDVTYGEQPGNQAGYQLISALDDSVQRQPAPATGPTATHAADSWTAVP